jgi:hypothetical protein
MSQAVRHISDGEEVVLWRGETFVIHPTPARELIPGRMGEPATAKPLVLAVQYLGFQNLGGRREYLLQARRGNEARRYTVSIELVAFSRRQALLQDGPDICYQKLLRELAGSELEGSEAIQVTDADLAAYHETHPRAASRISRPRLPAPPGADASANKAG